MLIVFLSGESKFQSTDCHFTHLPTLFRAPAAKKSPAVFNFSLALDYLKWENRGLWTGYQKMDVYLCPPFPYISQFIAQYLLVICGCKYVNIRPRPWSREQKTKMSIISDVYHFNHYFFVHNFADLCFRVIRRVGEFFSLVSLPYAQLWNVESKTFKFKITMIRRYSWRTTVHNISGEKVFISILYIKIHLIKLRYSIFPYISSYFKHFTCPIVFVSCLQQTARVLEPPTYVLPNLVMNVKDWSAKDSR